MKILVTGGCGFIGSHLVDRLVKDGHNVIVVDDLSASENDNFYYNTSAEYIKMDISDPEIINLTTLTGIEIVFHMAAESRIQPAIQNPSRAYRINVIGTLNILEVCKKNNVRRIIYSSTSSVYGTTTNFPTVEEEIVDCLNPYSHSKYMGELLIKEYTNKYINDSVILRYFNVFGERSPVKGSYAPVVGIFINQYKNKLPLTIVGDGHRKRDFIHVSDVVEANILSMLHLPNLNGKIFNVGYGSNFSIKNIADNISQSQIHIEDRKGESENTLADITELVNHLGFQPKIDLMDWIKNNIIDV